MLYVDQYVARTRGGEIGGTSMGNSETIFDTVSSLFKHIAGQQVYTSHSTKTTRPHCFHKEMSHLVQ